MISPLAEFFGGLAADIPVDPDGDQARQWLINELAKPEYQAAKPNLWDILSKGFWDWLNSLRVPGDGIFQAPLLLLLGAVVTAAIVAAFVIFGRPRRNRKSATVGALFGEGENRSADELRRSARAAAAAHDWPLAIEELFRSIARRLSERVLVSTTPGTTARGFAARASAVFPEHAAALAASAVAFDGVRYLGAPGSADEYGALVELDNALATARPASVGAAAT